MARGGETGRNMVKPVITVVLVLAVASVVMLLDTGRVLESLEYKAYDLFFYLRAQAGSGPEDNPAPLVIVGIDDRTFADPNFRLPQTLWHHYFSTVILGLTEGRAKAVCLDFLLPQVLFDESVPDYSRTWLRAFGLARHKKTPVISGVVEMGGRQMRPADRYLQILGLDNIGSFNLTADRDDFIRRQRLFYPTADDPARGLFSVTYLMARAEKPDIKPPAEYVYIDYRTEKDPFPELSFAEVYYKAKEMDRDWLAGHFKDKIVFIGETDTLSDDRHPTPLYHLPGGGLKRTAGVRILAHTVDTLLGQRFFKEIPAYWRLALFLILGLAASMLTVYGPARFIPAIPPVLTAVYFAICLAAFIGYWLLPAALGLLTVLLTWGLSFAYRYFVLDREKRKTKTIFTRYLPAQVVDRVLAAREADFFLGESRRLCLMFTDIRSFTTYSEKKDPVEVVRRLNEYFEAMSAVIISEHGIVDKFLGDGIMAFFGAFDDGEPSLAGARAALKMMVELEKLNQKWAAAGEETFRIGIGVHTGPVKVGNIGSHKKMEYTVIGDAVNLASRLQDKTKALGEEIIISEEVYQDLGDRAEVVDKGFTDIKGRSESRVYGLKGLKQVA